MGVKTSGRLIIPSNPGDLLKLAAKVYAKYVADGEDSTLHHMRDYDWAVSGPKIAQSQAAHDAAERYKGLMEEAYRERDLHMAEIKEITRKTGSFLKAANAKNPKRLTDYGFEVDDTPPVPKKGL